jgi:hypothetical protein
MVPMAKVSTSAAMIVAWCQKVDEPLIKRFVLLAVCAAGLAAVQAALAAATPRVPVTINVRWAPAMADADRPGLESRFTLSDGQRGEGTTWRYTLADTSSANVKALVTHPSVEDTSNIDRANFRALAVPPLVSRRSLALAATGALLLVGCRPFLHLGVFWGVIAALTAAAVLAARSVDAADAVLLTRPHWMLAAGMAALAVVPAVRGTLSLSARMLGLTVAVPQAAALVLVGATAALAWVGVDPFWRDRVPASLAAAAYEGDWVEVTRLLEAGADPRATAEVDGRARSALEAAIQSGDDLTLNLVLTAAGPLDDALRQHLQEVAAEADNPRAAARLSAR